MMSDNTAVAPPQDACAALAGADGKIVIETRFGEIAFDSDAAIRLPKGMPGFPSVREFGLAPIPDRDVPQFMVFQCLTDPDVCFLVAPYNTDDGTIAQEDLNAAYEALGIAREAAAVLLIVTIRRMGQAATVSVNLRAPLILDTARRMGWQHVLANPDYAIQHML